MSHLLGGAVVLLAFLLPARVDAEETRELAGSNPIQSSPTVAAARTPGPASSTLSSSALPATSTSDVDETRFAGTYIYVGGDSERAVVKAAVYRATEGMFGKVIARDELMRRSEPRPSYTIRFEEDGKVSVETPGFPSESSPVDGTEVVARNKFGDVVKQSQEFVDGALLQSGRNDDGSGSTEFRLESDGNTLQVTRVSRSPRLPRPVAYSLTYYRQPQKPR